MGRYYYGDIEGKFHFGVQSSDDINNLIDNIEHEHEYEWITCGCNVESKEDKSRNYCNDCYSSYEEHKQEILKNEDEGCIHDNCLYIERNFIYYSIQKNDHYENLLTSMKKLEENLGDDMINLFQEIEKENSVIDGLSSIFEEIHTFLHHYLDSLNDEEKVSKYLTIFARYKLGFQIKHVLKKEGSDSCFVSCEC
jgi:hypothetical protein